MEKVLEELFESEGEIVNSEGNSVFVEPVGAPKIIFYSDRAWELKYIDRKAPSGANAFIRGEKDEITKRREPVGPKYWPPLSPIFDTFYFRSVQYYDLIKGNFLVFK